MLDHDDDHKRKRHHHHAHGAERSEGQTRESGTFQSIGDEDYFRLNAEFREWLQDDSGKQLFFDELSSEKARKQFGKFVETWNSGRLIGKRIFALLPLEVGSKSPPHSPCWVS